MKTLTMEIPLPEGYQFDKVDSGKIILKEKPKNVLECILTDDDVLADNGYTWLTFNKWCDGLSEDEKATRFLKLLNKSLNCDWVPDFDNSNVWKYEPRFLGGSSGFRYDDCDYWTSHSCVGSRLCFDTEEKAVHAGTKFTKWYKQVIITK